ncbi:glycosyltransferase family 4 protein [Hyphococcus flavus]|uniref:Glycosyltransferase family 4 protein n=1 Tax=Hyphococcus flavus TaxID=1866326 RepID=A0AAF0CFQ0_9PROT|nr:glycosyltransferase family 4 protein [Hyphococcus flavus]WDI31258.1 glycosyltransferase family 4 protein [Hyphococcus flavus]
MNLAYLMNTYPLISTTFIRREIEALERRGISVTRYAMRQWDDALVDPLDKAEIEKTRYILSGNALGLLGAFIRACFTNPAGLARAIGPWRRLKKNARGGFIRHAAYFLEAVYFRQRAKRDEIDHVHVHFSTNATAVAMLARIMGGPSYSFTVHGPDELTDAPLLSFPEKIEHAAFVIAISNFCKSQIIRFSSIKAAEKIHIVHCGLNLKDFDFSGVPRTQEIVCVGRLCPQKGQAQIPAAVAALKAEFPDIKVTLIGDGESRAEIEAEIERCGVAENVEITGWMENEKVREAVSGGRCFLLPTFAEGLPVVIMEALALGRPVISTYIAGIPELVDDGCGWIIPAGDRKALIGALRSALNSSEDLLVAKAAEGRRRVELAHDVDKEAAKLKALFSASCAEQMRDKSAHA